MPARTIVSLPKELTDILFQLGTRRLVLLEGDDDVEVLERWFREDLNAIFFYAAEGNKKVESHLNSILNDSSRKEVYGIVDRDFRTDEEVSTQNDDMNTHLFVLCRYAIENYLLEPRAVWEELEVFHGRAFTETIETVSSSLLDICRNLKTMMAANWVINEAYARDDIKAPYFSKGHEIINRDDIIDRVSDRLQYEIAATEQKIREKEEIIESELDTLDKAHKFINGKHLFHQIHEKYVKKGLTRNHLRNLLARTIKEKIGVHDDLREIVKKRILR